MAVRGFTRSASIAADAENTAGVRARPYRQNREFPCLGYLSSKGGVAFLLREERTKEGANDAACFCGLPEVLSLPATERNSQLSSKGKRAFLLREEGANKRKGKEGASDAACGFEKSLFLRLAAKWPFHKRPKAFLWNSFAVLVPLESPTSFRCRKVSWNHRAGKSPLGPLGAAVQLG